MAVIVLIEEVRGQYEALGPPLKPRPSYCRCNGQAVRGSDSCLRCGRYKRGHFSPYISSSEQTFDYWNRFMRERAA